VGRESSATEQNAGAYDLPVNDTVVLHADATPSAAALALRPWCAKDVAALVEVFRDPVLRQWTSSVVENEADAARWVRGQERGWSAGERFGFAVLETRSGPADGQLVGHVVLKEAVAGRPSAEVGYWTAAMPAGVGSRRALWRLFPAGPSTPWAPTGWSVWNSCTRWTIRPRAVWRTRADTTSTGSCPRRRPRFPARGICTYGAGVTEIHRRQYVAAKSHNRAYWLGSASTLGSWPTTHRRDVDLPSPCWSSGRRCHSQGGAWPTSSADRKILPTPPRRWEL